MGSVDEEVGFRDLLLPVFETFRAHFHECDKDQALEVSLDQLLIHLQIRGLQQSVELEICWKDEFPARDELVTEVKWILLLGYWFQKKKTFARLFVQFETVDNAMLEVLDFYDSIVNEDEGLNLDTAQKALAQDAAVDITPYVSLLPTDQERLSYPQFLLLIYAGLLNGVTQSHNFCTAEQAVLSIDKFLEDLELAFASIEQDFLGAGGKDGYIGWVDINRSIHHDFALLPEVQETKCVGCNTKPGAYGCGYGCGYAGCRLGVCQVCYTNGLTSHGVRLGGSAPYTQKYVFRADLDTIFGIFDRSQSGFLDFMGYLAVAFSLSKYHPYTMLVPSASNPAHVKRTMATVRAKYQKYSCDRGNTMTQENVTEFLLDHCGPITRKTKNVLTSLFLGAKEIPLSGFWTVLYSLKQGTGMFDEIEPNTQEPLEITVPTLALEDPYTEVFGATEERLDAKSFDESQVKPIIHLGTGSTCHAYACVYIPDSTQHDLMRILTARCPSSSDPEAKAKFLEMARWQQHINHRNVVNVLAIWDEASTGLLCQPCDNGDLASLYNQYPRRLLDGANPIPLGLQWRVAVEIASALASLHEVYGLMHRDVKGGNVLFDSHFNAKLSDFESVTIDAWSCEITGTVGYMAPEVMAGQMYGNPCDVFSFGSLLYEMTHNRTPMTAEVPFLPGRHLDTYEVTIYNKYRAGIRPSIDPSKCAPKLALLIDDCWRPNPGSRPKMSAVLRQLIKVKAEVGA